MFIVVTQKINRTWLLIETELQHKIRVAHKIWGWATFFGYTHIRMDTKISESSVSVCTISILTTCDHRLIILLERSGYTMILCWRFRRWSQTRKRNFRGLWVCWGIRAALTLFFDLQSKNLTVGSLQSFWILPRARCLNISASLWVPDSLNQIISAIVFITRLTTKKCSILFTCCNARFRLQRRNDEHTQYSGNIVAECIKTASICVGAA